LATRKQDWQGGLGTPKLSGNPICPRFGHPEIQDGALDLTEMRVEHGDRLPDVAGFESSEALSLEDPSSY